MNKVFLLLVFNLQNAIDVPYFKNVQLILDGKLNEDVYKKAFKITDLIQTKPVPFKKPPESTTIYIFQSNEGLHIGFHCVTKGRKPDRSSQGDEVLLFLDTYLDRENAYMFGILANGEKYDARITNGGDRFDYNADFLWEGEVFCSDNYFEVEIFVPWKGIMGKKGKWGIDIVRKGPGGVYEARLSPFDPKKEKFHISRFKVIRMINLKIKLITTEIQPIFLLHHGEDFGERYNFKYEIGSNIYFKFRENVKFAFTFNPDFADVEADPFRLNLTKYPLFYSETRPFFIEGAEFFKLSGSFYFFNVFYSRQIGKTLPSGKIIPISFAGKFFIKSNFIEFSFLHAQTKKTEDQFTSVPRTDFIVNKIKILPEKKLSFSLLNAYKFPYREKVKGLISSEIFYNDSITSFNIIGVFDRYVSKDFAEKVEFERNIKNFGISFQFISIPDSFSDNEVGFIPIKGNKSVNSDLRYTFFINKKILYITPSLSFGYFRELGEPYGYYIRQSLSLTLNNLISLTPSFGYRKKFEMGNKIESPTFSLFISNLFLTSTKNKFNMFIQANADKIYNYNQNYIGWTNTNSLYLLFNVKNLSLVSYVTQWNEFNPEGKLDETTYSTHLSLNLNLFTRFLIKFYCDIPIKGSDILQERIGVFISWNPSGKNYIKTVYNDFQVKGTNEWDVLIKKITTKAIYSFHF